MPTLEGVREKVEARTKAAVEAEGRLRDTLQEASAAARRSEDEIAAILTATKDLSAVETLPMEFTGVVHNYRFGMLSDDLPAAKKDRGKKAAPSHRFEVECDDGLWLHIRCSSGEFDEFLTTTDFTGALDLSTELNGKTITVRRDKKNKRMVPVGLGVMSTPDAPSLGQDKFANALFKGDMVRLKPPKSGFTLDGERAFKATVMAREGNLWTFQRTDRKSPTQISQKSLNAYQKFEKIDAQGNAVKSPNPGIVFTVS